MVIWLYIYIYSYSSMIETFTLKSSSWRKLFKFAWLATLIKILYCCTNVLLTGQSELDVRAPRILIQIFYCSAFSSTVTGHHSLRHRHTHTHIRCTHTSIHTHTHTHTHLTHARARPLQPTGAQNKFQFRRFPPTFYKRTDRWRLNVRFLNSPPSSSPPQPSFPSSRRPNPATCQTVTSDPA